MGHETVLWVIDMDLNVFPLSWSEWSYLTVNLLFFLLSPEYLP